MQDEYVPRFICWEDPRDRIMLWFFDVATEQGTKGTCNLRRAIEGKRNRTHSDKITARATYSLVLGPCDVLHVVICC